MTKKELKELEKLVTHLQITEQKVLKARENLYTYPAKGVYTATTDLLIAILSVRAEINHYVDREWNAFMNITIERKN